MYNISQPANKLTSFGWRFCEFSKVYTTLSQNTFINSDIGPMQRISQINHFILSIPKCGTTAIQKGFQRAGREVLHAHNNPTTYDAFTNGDTLRDAGINLEMLCRYRRHTSPNPMHFFFGYREPVSWYLSLAAQFSLAFDGNLKRNILKNISRKKPWNQYAFNETLKVVESAIGMRLLQGTFDQERGITVLKQNDVSIVLYRFDRLKELCHYIQSNIEPEFTLEPERVNDNMRYKEYCQSFKLPRKVLYKLYHNSSYRFFYSPGETGNFINKYAAD